MELFLLNVLFCALLFINFSVRPSGILRSNEAQNFRSKEIDKQESKAFSFSKLSVDINKVLETPVIFHHMKISEVTSKHSITKFLKAGSLVSNHGKTTEKVKKVGATYFENYFTNIFNNNFGYNKILNGLDLHVIRKRRHTRRNEKTPEADSFNGNLKSKLKKKTPQLKGNNACKKRTSRWVNEETFNKYKLNSQLEHLNEKIEIETTAKSDYSMKSSDNKGEPKDEEFDIEEERDVNKNGIVTEINENLGTKNVRKFLNFAFNIESNSESNYAATKMENKEACVNENVENNGGGIEIGLGNVVFGIGLGLGGGVNQKKLCQSSRPRKPARNYNKWGITYGIETINTEQEGHTDRTEAQPAEPVKSNNKEPEVPEPQLLDASEKEGKGEIYKKYCESNLEDSNKINLQKTFQFGPFKYEKQLEISIQNENPITKTSCKPKSTPLSPALFGTTKTQSVDSSAMYRIHSTSSPRYFANQSAFSSSIPRTHSISSSGTTGTQSMSIPSMSSTQSISPFGYFPNQSMSSSVLAETESLPSSGKPPNQSNSPGKTSTKPMSQYSYSTKISIIFPYTYPKKSISLLGISETQNFGTSTIQTIPFPGKSKPMSHTWFLSKQLQKFLFSYSRNAPIDHSVTSRSQLITKYISQFRSQLIYPLIMRPNQQPILSTQYSAKSDSKSIIISPEWLVSSIITGIPSSPTLTKTSKKKKNSTLSYKKNNTSTQKSLPNNGQKTKWLSSTKILITHSLSNFLNIIATSSSSSKKSTIASQKSKTQSSRPKNVTANSSFLFSSPLPESSSSSKINVIQYLFFSSLKTPKSFSFSYSDTKLSLPNINSSKAIITIIQFSLYFSTNGTKKTWPLKFSLKKIISAALFLSSSRKKTFSWSSAFNSRPSFWLSTRITQSNYESKMPGTQVFSLPLFIATKSSTDSINSNSIQSLSVIGIYWSKFSSASNFSNIKGSSYGISGNIPTKRTRTYVIQTPTNLFNTKSSFLPSTNSPLSLSSPSLFRYLDMQSLSSISVYDLKWQFSFTTYYTQFSYKPNMYGNQKLFTASTYDIKMPYFLTSGTQLSLPVSINGTQILFLISSYETKLFYTARIYNNKSLILLGTYVYQFSSFLDTSDTESSFRPSIYGTQLLLMSKSNDLKYISRVSEQSIFPKSIYSNDSLPLLSYSKKESSSPPSIYKTQMSYWISTFDTQPLSWPSITAIKSLSMLSINNAQSSSLFTSPSTQSLPRLNINFNQSLFSKKIYDSQLSSLFHIFDTQSSPSIVVYNAKTTYWVDFPDLESPTRQNLHSSQLLPWLSTQASSGNFGIISSSTNNKPAHDILGSSASELLSRGTITANQILSRLGWSAIRYSFPKSYYNIQYSFLSNTYDTQYSFPISVFQHLFLKITLHTQYLFQKSAYYTQYTYPKITYDTPYSYSANTFDTQYLFLRSMYKIQYSYTLITYDTQYSYPTTTFNAESSYLTSTFDTQYLLHTNTYDDSQFSLQTRTYYTFYTHLTSTGNTQYSSLKINFFIQFSYTTITYDTLLIVYSASIYAPQLSFLLSTINSQYSLLTSTYNILYSLLRNTYDTQYSFTEIYYSPNPCTVSNFYLQYSLLTNTYDTFYFFRTSFYNAQHSYATSTLYSIPTSKYDSQYLFTASNFKTQNLFLMNTYDINYSYPSSTYNTQHLFLTSTFDTHFSFSAITYDILIPYSRSKYDTAYFLFEITYNTQYFFFSSTSDTLYSYLTMTYDSPYLYLTSIYNTQHLYSTSNFDAQYSISSSSSDTQSPLSSIYSTKSFITPNAYRVYQSLSFFLLSATKSSILVILSSQLSLMVSSSNLQSSSFLKFFLNKSYLSKVDGTKSSSSALTRSGAQELKSFIIFGPTSLSMLSYLASQSSLSFNLLGTPSSSTISPVNYDFQVSDVLICSNRVSLFFQNLSLSRYSSFPVFRVPTITSFHSLDNQTSYLASAFGLQTLKKKTGTQSFIFFSAYLLLSHNVDGSQHYLSSNAITFLSLSISSSFGKQSSHSLNFIDIKSSLLLSSYNTQASLLSFSYPQPSFLSVSSTQISSTSFFFGNHKAFSSSFYFTESLSVKIFSTQTFISVSTDSDQSLLTVTPLYTPSSVLSTGNNFKVPYFLNSSSSSKQLSSVQSILVTQSPSQPSIYNIQLSSANTSRAHFSLLLILSQIQSLPMLKMYSTHMALSPNIYVIGSENFSLSKVRSHSLLSPTNSRDRSLVVTFFSIKLPSSIITYILEESSSPNILNAESSFFFSSYKTQSFSPPSLTRLQISSLLKIHGTFSLSSLSPSYHGSPSSPSFSSTQSATFPSMSGLQISSLLKIYSHHSLSLLSSFETRSSSTSGISGTSSTYPSNLSRTKIPLATQLSTPLRIHPTPSSYFPSSFGLQSSYLRSFHSTQPPSLPSI